MFKGKGLKSGAFQLWVRGSQRAPPHRWSADWFSSWESFLLSTAVAAATMSAARASAT
jgi:hypothetical protein